MFGKKQKSVQLISPKLKANKQHSPNGEITVRKSKSGVNCPFDWMSTKEKEIIN